MTTGTRFQQDTVVTIKGGLKSETTKLAGWKYWEIVGELTWRGADRNKATDGAKWCARAETGSEKSIPVSGRPEIILKVR